MALAQWLLLLMCCLVGIFGLFMAAADAGEGTLYAFGLLVFAASVVCGFALVKRHFDRVDAERY